MNNISCKFLIFVLFLSLSISGKDILIEPGPNAHERLQEAMILMNEGDTLIIESGNYQL